MLAPIIKNTGKREKLRGYVVPARVELNRMVGLFVINVLKKHPLRLIFAEKILDG